MYCPVCGEEIIIVSDFDIKIEDNIDVAALAKTTELPDLSGIINKQGITREIEAPTAGEDEFIVPDPVLPSKTKKIIAK